ncbi:hypothetical protein Salat_1549000 [Sesamum alatum]|uniref:Uncharacterized protein n=1 Tax=Sesamum alatum TaxID=300844 RepID=A0AAE1YCV5_9LAMI|nr:hypothetical protein Salat_1549000 [Sesamum alatum]
MVRRKIVMGSHNVESQGDERAPPFEEEIETEPLGRIPVSQEVLVQQDTGIKTYEGCWKRRPKEEIGLTNNMTNSGPQKWLDVSPGRKGVLLEVVMPHPSNYPAIWIHPKTLT